MAMDRVRSMRNTARILIFFSFIYFAIAFMSGGKDGAWVGYLAFGAMWGMSYALYRSARYELINLPMRQYVNENMDAIIKGL